MNQVNQEKKPMSAMYAQAFHQRIVPAPPKSGKPNTTTETKYLIRNFRPLTGIVTGAGARP
jgi:hypothetical protein